MSQTVPLAEPDKRGSVQTILELAFEMALAKEAQQVSE
jgi:hypothetical protein